MNRIDMGYKHYRGFAEVTAGVLLDDLIYKHEQNDLCVDAELEAKEELDRRMQYICDSLEYYGFKPTCNMVEESRNNT